MQARPANRQTSLARTATVVLRVGEKSDWGVTEGQAAFSHFLRRIFFSSSVPMARICLASLPF